MGRPAKAKPAPAPETAAAPAPAPPTSGYAPAPGPITTLPLACLCLSELNVRRTERDADIQPLADDIAAKGLKQNLVVIPAHFSTAEIEGDYGDRFEVVAGGRRYQALRLLADAGRIAADMPIPVLVEARADARETSLSENLHRVAMNPADEFDAFAAIAKAHMAARGHADQEPDAEAVAYVTKRFGVTLRHVQGRLRLASLAAEVLEALRAGAINLDSAKAYAGTTDHALQLKAFNAQLKSHYNQHDPRAVRDLLRGESLSIDDPRVKFIGLDVYRAAGGTTETEMFMGTDGEERITNPGLLEDLVRAEAEDRLPELSRRGGWKQALYAKGLGYTARLPKTPEGYVVHQHWQGEPTEAERADRIAVFALNRTGDEFEEVGHFKPVGEDPPRSSYVPETPEQRVARERQFLIDVWSARLAVGPFTGTPLEGRAFWPLSNYDSVDWEFAEQDDQADQAEDEDDTPVSALVALRIRVTAEAIAAALPEAEAKADQIMASRAAEQAAREARQAEADSKLDDEADEDQSGEFDDTDLEGEDAS